MVRRVGGGAAGTDVEVGEAGGLSWQTARDDEMTDHSDKAVKKWATWSRRFAKAPGTTGVKFKVNVLKEHFKAHLPNCPEEVRHELYRRIRSRHWETTIGQAVGITVDTFVRHELTDYNKLCRSGTCSREQAGKIVRGQVLAIIESWGPRAIPTIPVLDD